MEQGTGVEPAFTAWEAVVLPIYEPCSVCGYYSRQKRKIQVPFVDFLIKCVGVTMMCDTYIRIKPQVRDHKVQEKVPW